VLARRAQTVKAVGKRSKTDEVKAYRKRWESQKLAKERDLFDKKAAGEISPSDAKLKVAEARKEKERLRSQKRDERIQDVWWDHELGYRNSSDSEYQRVLNRKNKQKAKEKRRITTGDRQRGMSRKKKDPNVPQKAKVTWGGKETTVKSAINADTAVRAPAPRAIKKRVISHNPQVVDESIDKENLDAEDEASDEDWV